MQMIRIVDEKYRFLCEVENGRILKVSAKEGSGKSIIENCRYLDEYHFQFGNRTFHICQFGEWLKQNGYQAEPVGYTMDYRKYPVSQYFGHTYYCLDQCSTAAFYYNPEIEYPFMVQGRDGYGRAASGIPYVGDTFTWVVTYDHAKAKWNIDFNMEKIKSMVAIDLPKIVMDTEEMELLAETEVLSEKRTDLQEAYVERDLLSYEERDRLLEEIYQLQHYEPKLLKGAKMKQEFAEQISNPLKVYTEKDFKGCDFSGVDVSGYTFIRCNLTDCHIEEGNLKKAAFIECDFDYSLQKSAQNEQKGKETERDQKHGKI